MEFDLKQDCTGVDWKVVSDTLKRVGMAYYEPDLHKKAFEASHTTVFIYHDDRLIGLVEPFLMASIKQLSMIVRFFLNSKERGSERRSWITSYLRSLIAT